MPELPEVETVMRAMCAALLGETISTVLVRRPDLRWPFPVDLKDRLTGSRIESFRRRGKYIFMRLSTGQSMLLHFGMSGRVAVGPTALAAGSPPPHEHLSFETREGTRFGLVDPRRFGAVDLVATTDEDTYRLVAQMGPEPLDAGFSAAHLRSRFVRKAAPIKAALLDQASVAGLGNIYVCEALYRSGIHPKTPCGTLSEARLRRLVADCRSVLEEAIAAGGSSLRDYVQPDGELGYFQHAWSVYGREGMPCPRCGPKPPCPGISRIVQSGRSTFFCARQQRLRAEKSR